jgi:L-ribulose-5-phosphate 3-epimerase
MTRRHFLETTGVLAGASALHPLLTWDDELSRRFKIGACDWSLGKSSDIGAFDLAQQIGLQGLMVNLGDTKNDLHLRQASVQAQFKAAAKRTDIKISSIAIGELNEVPYKSDPRMEDWVADAIDVADNLDVPVVLLAFFAKNDLRNDPAGMAEVARRLKRVASKAEKKGIILGLETYLSGQEHLDIINQVGSKNVQVYYDFRNTADAGHDPIKEFKLIGKSRVCELHMKENRFLLRQGSLDWKGISSMIRDMGYRGDRWMQIEWSKPDDADLITSYKDNLDFLKGKFKA